MYNLALALTPALALVSLQINWSDKIISGFGDLLTKATKVLSTLKTTSIIQLGVDII